MVYKWLGPNRIWGWKWVTLSSQLTMSLNTATMPSSPKHVPMTTRSLSNNQLTEDEKSWRGLWKKQCCLLDFTFTVECVYLLAVLLFLEILQPKIDGRAGVLLDSSRIFMPIWDKWHIQPCELNCYQVLSLSSTQSATVGFISQGSKPHLTIYAHFVNSVSLPCPN